VRDGNTIARLGIPSLALVTDEFWPQGDFVAQSRGMPGAPRLRLPHPVAGTGDANLRRIAEQIGGDILECLQ
jgi:hypothetical protein